MFSSDDAFPATKRDGARRAGPRVFGAIWPIVRSKLLEAQRRAKLADAGEIVTTSPSIEPTYPRAA